MLSWRSLLPAAGQTIVAIAEAFGPVPGAVAKIGVSLTERAIELAEQNADPVTTIEALEDQAIELLKQLKFGLGKTPPPDA